MARKASEDILPETVAEQTTALAIKELVGPPDIPMEDLEKNAGRGFSQRREDSVLPMVRILQDLSPQVKPRDPAYIEGAKAGDFYIAASNRVIPGTPGLVGVIPCGFAHEYVEWRPRGQGGMVGRHPLDKLPPDAQERTVFENGKDRVKMLRDNNNQLVDTRYHFFVYEGQGFVIPFSSTGHQSSRRWTFMMSSHRLPNGRPYPGFARKYQLKTMTKRNAEGEWYVVEPVDLGWSSREEYLLGRAMANAIEAGDKVPEDESEEVPSSSLNDEIPF